jgi:group I intron endonuclease
MIGYIYKITNPSGRIYIGKTKNTKNRFNQYKNLNCKTQPALYNSLLKYGYENHSVEVIHKCDYSELSKFEIDFISKYNSFHNGLNATFGGDDGFLLGEYNVAKRPEVRKKMSDAKIKWYKNNNHYGLGLRRSEETIEKIKLKRSKQEPIIRCYVMDLESGVFYYGIKELSDLLNLKYKSFFYSIRHTDKYKNKYLVC